MKVKDLIEQLEKMDPESEVIVVDSLDGAIPVRRAKARKQFDLGPQHLKGNYTWLVD